jgi:hypothetical protein
MIYIIEHKTDIDIRDDILRATTKKFDSEIDNTWIFLILQVIMLMEVKSI